MGAETPRNIHDDLEVSDSEDEDDDSHDQRKISQPNQPPEDDGDGLWF